LLIFICLDFALTFTEINKLQTSTNNKFLFI
jgi:hypothetical protein